MPHSCTREVLRSLSKVRPSTRGTRPIWARVGKRQTTSP